MCVWVSRFITKTINSINISCIDAAVPETVAVTTSLLIKVEQLMDF